MGVIDINNLKIGEISNNKFGTPMKIVRYNKTDDMTIEFQDEHRVTVNTWYRKFIIGQIKNPYDKTKYGVGYIGVGRHKSRYDSITQNPYYTTWTYMLERCYSEKLRYKHPTYDDCYVCDEWHNFQIFADWCEINYYSTHDNKRMHIDKDILVKGNKIYSPEACMIVPQRINMMFMTKTRSVDVDLPQGIRRYRNVFMSEYNTKYLGAYKTIEEAIEKYMVEKRIHIKEVADEYKDKIPPKVYNALLEW